MIYSHGIAILSQGLPVPEVAAWVWPIAVRHAWGLTITTSQTTLHLLFHGSIVLVYALLCGAPYGRAITRGAATRTIEAWRLAHSSLTIGATLMLVVALVLPLLAIATPMKWIIAISFIVSSYAFCVALTLGPILGHRGLSSEGPGSAKLVYLGNIVGAGASLIGAVGLLYGSFVSLIGD